jgi:hypothetical protein
VTFAFFYAKPISWNSSAGLEQNSKARLKQKEAKLAKFGSERDLPRAGSVLGNHPGPKCFAVEGLFLCYLRFLLFKEFFADFCSLLLTFQFVAPDYSEIAYAQRETD